MAMKSLNPAPKVELDNGWTLLATEAGRYKEGLRATTFFSNGERRASQTLSLSDPEARHAAAEAIAAQFALDVAALEQALLDLWEGVEGALREQARHKAPTQADQLVALAREHGAELFHTPDEVAYATVPVGGHCETWAIAGTDFRRWLTRLFYEARGKAPSAQGLQDALGTLAGKAHFDGPECPVFVRLAECGGMLYLDLADADWQAVEITAADWRVMAEPPVKFQRPHGMLALPTPVAGGSLTELRPFVNVDSDEDWILLVSWLVAGLRPTGPYTVLVVSGEQGSAKSTLVRVLRTLVDPNAAPLRAQPREERDLMIAAKHGHVIALDNLSGVQPWLSDALCRLATGGGFGTRQLYTDEEEVIFQAQRPVVINGIDDLATRSDLLDRALLLNLPTIEEDARKAEQAFWHDFERAQPRILGALLDAISGALRTLPRVQLTHTPRMADFAVWGCAAAAACGWPAEAFLHAYEDNRRDAHALALENSSVPGVLFGFLARHPDGWEGTASELQETLKERIRNQDAMVSGVLPKDWPESPNALGRLLRRLAPNLRAVGVEVVFKRASGGQRHRLIALRTTGQDKAPSEEPAEDERDGRDNRDDKIHDSSVEEKNKN